MHYKQVKIQRKFVDENKYVIALVNLTYEKQCQIYSSGFDLILDHVSAMDYILSIEMALADKS